MESSLPVTQADAVVIGAGAFGLSAGYQLAAHGAGRVVVLDRFAPGTQTSPRAAGLYKLIQADEILTRLAQSSIEVIRGFSDATGIPLSFVQSGSVLAAASALRISSPVISTSRSPDRCSMPTWRRSRDLARLSSVEHR